MGNVLILEKMAFLCILSRVFSTKHGRMLRIGNLAAANRVGEAPINISPCTYSLSYFRAAN